MTHSGSLQAIAIVPNEGGNRRLAGEPLLRDEEDVTDLGGSEMGLRAETKNSQIGRAKQAVIS
jgi:hypothetical protein